jgi:tight adherence protein C
MVISISNSADFAVTLAIAPAGRWALAIGFIALAAWALQRVVSRRAVRRRLLAASPSSAALRTAPAAGGVLATQEAPSGLQGWLASSGFDGPAARIQFLFTIVGTTLAAILIALTFEAIGFQEKAILWLEEIPGGLADLFVPVMRAAPWLLAILLAFTPVVWVRKQRRKRQEQVERDLPYVLSLLATLVESGLGFDAAAMRVERALGPDRVLSQELARVRATSLAGAPRSVGIRQMAQRLDVPSLTAFSSALIHAENQGASVGETLRRQATDLWARRREEAIQSAQTLPTKLAFPLVICFLPGIFVWTFGPAVAEFLRLAGSAFADTP